MRKRHDPKSNPEPELKEAPAADSGIDERLSNTTPRALRYRPGS
jgi:hypothetical protein